MIKIAFISDIHFGELARTNEFMLPGETSKGDPTGAASLSKSLVEILKQDDVEYIFIGGDLTSRARPQEFYYCEKKLLDIAELSGISPEHIISVVGNHDVDWCISKLGENCEVENEEVKQIAKEAYRKIAASVAAHNLESLYKTSKPGPIPLTGVLETDDFVVFMLNSSGFCTHDQSFAHGKLSIDQLKWFKQTLKDYETINKWKIVLIHHHPHNYTYPTPGEDVSALEEGSELINIAGEAGINLILHGHRHHPKAETILKNNWKKPITFICAGSLAVNAAHRSNGDIPNTFHIIGLHDDIGILTLNNYEYSTSRGWGPVFENRTELPLDATMKLGKVLTQEDLLAVITSMCEFEEDYKTFKWDDFEDTLKFFPAKKVNKLMNTVLSPKYKVVGKFPDTVLLIKNQGGQNT